MENPKVTIEDLDPATEYKVWVSASNTAGIRIGVLPAEIIFKTGGFKGRYMKIYLVLKVELLEQVL